MKIYWYASCAEIKWMGPYETELIAWKALIGLDGLPVPSGRVWCTDKKLALRTE